jgi:tRNA threonylcarbamoyladenosine biosynthesis protein TsaB
MRILSIDTASAQCSAALLLDDETRERSIRTARDHAQLLLPMVDALLAEAGITLRQLDGIAFGRGPGSFTGLRVAASVTQGLATGAGLPVRPVSDLRALAEQARRRAGAIGPTQVLACMDARMGEVYWALFSLDGGQIHTTKYPERVDLPAALLQVEERPSLAAGLGLATYPRIREGLGIVLERCYLDAEPHALDIAALARVDLAAGAAWLEPSAAQPVYLRDDVARVQA